ncbi:MAG: FimV/HubP family polar landmark protein [Pseudomonadota bacterium]
MVRKSSIYILFIFILALIPGQLLSLGLGDIEVNSALNQPLNAQINLIAAREDEFEEMRVELAPANVFDRVGVPRPYFLTQLKFQPIKLPGGGTAIRVTSKDPVREPFLTFLVEVTWPKGRLLREYTVLLDPPEFAQQQAPQIATPVTAPAEAPVVEAEPVASQVSSQPEIVEAEDIEAVRARMDRELGIDDDLVMAEDIEAEAPVVEEVVVETIAEDLDPPLAETEPSVEELEEAVVESVEEVQSSEIVTEEIVETEEIAVADTEDLETVRARMDEALGIDGSEPIESDAAEVIEDSEVILTDTFEGDVVVQGGDTLFAIAKSTAPSGTSVNQMMLAIQQANPNAFIKNNVNLLKKGSVLRIPAADASVISTTEARREIAQQNALWREYRGKVGQTPAANVDAPALVKEEASDKAKAAEQALKDTAKKTESKQDLNILAADKSGESSNTQLAGGEEIKKLQKEINLAKEQALSKSKESEELKSRVQELESMLEKKEKILNIQSQQLKDLQNQLSTETEKTAEVEKTLKEKAALEAELKAQQAAQKAAEEAKLKAEEEAKKAAELAQLKAKEEAEKAAEAAAKKAADAEVKKPVVEPLPEFKDEPAMAEQSVSTPRLEPLPDWDSLPEIEEPVAEQVAEAVPEEKPAEVETKPEVKPDQPAEVATADAGKGLLESVLGFLDRFKSQLQIGTGVLAVLLGGIWFWRRKQVKTIELTSLGEMPMGEAEDGDNFDDILDETIVTPQANATAQVTQEDMGAMEGFDDTDSTPEPAFASGDTEAGEDVLDEADVYISYGLHQQAQDLLNDAIAKEPNRNDYKAKLAEVFYSQKDQAGFEEYAEKIKGDLGESSSEWQNIMSMGKELAPASALFAGAAAVGAAAKSALDKPEEADIDLGIQADEGLEDTVLDNDAETDDGGLDFNIDDPVDELEDDPVASKIMEANETSDILNFDVDDLADDILEADEDEDKELDAIATGLHETASMDDLTEELENIGMQTTMNDLKPLDIDDDGIDDILDGASDDTVAMTPDEMGIDTGISEPDPEATAAYTSSSINDALNETEQFDPSNMDTEFLDPAEQTVAQTHTDLEELGPPSLIEEVGTKLDLAKAFVDMGDSDAAKETLIEVINEGDESQIKAAKDLMDKLGG